MTTRRVVAMGVVIACCLCAPQAAAQTDAPLSTSRYRADLRFRTLSTGNFDIHFHQGEEALAQRLARIVAEVAPAVDRRLGAPTGRVRVVLVDQADVSNGWATIIPYNLIEIAAAPPAASDTIGNTDDWLRMVFAHEYTHIAHLEKSRGLLGRLRKVFGRIPLAYSNLFVPGWQIEGLATFEESEITGLGRVPARDFRMLIDEDARAGRFAPLDRAAGGVIDWPGGTLPYLYGAYFHDYLARRFGAGTLARLADETAGRLPFTGSRAFETIFGESLGTLWKAFEDDTLARAAGVEPDDGRRTRVTAHGFTVTAPAFSSDGRLFYSVANPHGFPALMELREGSAPRRVASRFHGLRLAAAGQTLVFDELEVAGQVDLQSDLYALDLASGATRRLTRGARAADPDVAPDGRTVACTLQQSGRRLIATFAIPAGGHLAQPVPLVSEEATEFSSPRWSPDGRSLVAERRRLGGPSEIVVIDVESRRVRPIVSTREARNISPLWLPPEGGRERILFSSTLGGRPFTLHAVDVGTGEVRRLAGAGPGAQSPALSPDGTRLVYVGYSADGYDLYSVRFDSAEWIGVGVFQEAAPPVTPAPQAAALESRAYSPLPTLAPRFWIPYIEVDGDDTVIGAGTGGFDALGRHTYALAAGWAVSRRQADVYAEYSYTRWRPALFAGLSDDTDGWRDGDIRSREASAGFLLPFRQVRWSSDVLASVSLSQEDRFSPSEPDRSGTRRRTAVRVGWSVSSAKRFGYSISAEEGAAFRVVSEFAAGRSGGGDGTARSVAAELRAYVRAVPRHGVVAMRLAGATSRGDERVRRDFSAGGSGPQGGGFDIGVEAVGLLRGFATGDLFGRSAAVANLDYRVPLGWPQRGAGTLPLTLRSLHGALFVDTGTAWDERFRSAALRRSVGGELSADVMLGWTIPVTVAAGGAWRHDPSRTVRGFAAFVRIGRAF